MRSARLEGLAAFVRLGFRPLGRSLHLTSVLCLLLSACDSVPLVELRNGAGQPVVLRPVKAVYEPKPPPEVIIRPGKAVRLLQWKSLTLSMGRCDLSYEVPSETLPTRLGSIIPLEIRPNSRIYLRAQPDAQGGYRHAITWDQQPAGWPLKPEENCRS